MKVNAIVEKDKIYIAKNVYSKAVNLKLKSIKIGDKEFKLKSG